MVNPAIPDAKYLSFIYLDLSTNIQILTFLLSAESSA